MMKSFSYVKATSVAAAIKALGAKVIRAPYQMGEGWIATLADPDGNFFQLMTPMV